MTYQVRSNHNLLKVVKVFENLQEAKNWCDKRVGTSKWGHQISHIENGKLVRDYDTYDMARKIHPDTNEERGKQRVF